MDDQLQFNTEDQALIDRATPEQLAKLEKDIARLKRNAERRAARERQKADERRAARQREKAGVHRARMEVARRLASARSQPQVDPVTLGVKCEEELARIKRNADRREARARLREKKNEGPKVDEEELARVRLNAERREACHRQMKETKEAKDLATMAAKMRIS